MATPPQCLPSIVYATYCGPIDQAAVQKIVAGLSRATIENVKEVHVMFQSLGGGVGDGIALYNFFRAFTVDLTLYNVGNISSIALVSYLGAKRRKTNTFATFMTHRTTSPAVALEGGKLKAMTESVLLDDQRTEAILRKHITMPEDKWAALETGLWFTATEAVKFGIADEIAEFAPPVGTKIFFF